MKTQLVSILSTTASALFLAANCFAANPALKIKSHPSEVEFNNEEEKPLEIEGWMLDQANWHYEKQSSPSGTLSIEPWMTDEELWTKKELKSDTEEIRNENESNLSIEPWMLDEKLWQTKKADN